MQHRKVVFQVLPDLERAGIFEKRLQQLEGGVEIDLAGLLVGAIRSGPAVAEQVTTLHLGLHMGERDVGGPPRRGGERDADEPGLGRVERIGLGIDRDHAGLVALGDPGLQLLDRGDRFVGRRVERLDRLRGAGRHERGGRWLGRRALSRRRLIRQVEIGEGIGFTGLGWGRAVRSLRGGLGLGVDRHGVAEERHGIAAAGGVGVGVGLCARQQRRIGLHGLRIDVQHLRDAPRERIELHGLEEADELLRIGLRHAQFVERHRYRYLLLERDEATREFRLIDVGEQRLPALGLLDFGGTLQKLGQAAVLLDQGGGRLQADAGHTRHVVGGVADQRQRVADLLRSQPLPLGDDRLAVEVALGPVTGLALGAGLEIVEPDLVRDELHQVLVGGHDDDLGTSRLGLARVGRDQVVGLVALQLHRVQSEGAHRVAHQRHLALEVVGRVGPMALVVREQLLTERALGLVEDDAEMGRLHPRRAVLKELGDLGAEQAYRTRRQSVGGPRVVLLVLIDRLEVRSENEGRAVDEDHPVLGADGLVRLRLGLSGHRSNSHRRAETRRRAAPIHRAFSPARDIAPMPGNAADPRLLPSPARNGLQLRGGRAASSRKGISEGSPMCVRAQCNLTTTHMRETYARKRFFRGRPMSLHETSMPNRSF